MGIISAGIAFLEALDGPRSGSGHAPPAAAPVPVQAPPPLGSVLEELMARVANLETQFKQLRPYVDEEVERARRHVEGLRTTVRRLKEGLEGSGELDQPVEGVPGGDASAGPAGGVLPMHGRVEDPAPASPEAIRAAARRAVAFS